MGKLDFKDKIKEIISSLGWKMFIWGLGMTQEEYWEEIYQQEKRNKKNVKSTPSPTT